MFYFFTLPTFCFWKQRQVCSLQKRAARKTTRTISTRGMNEQLVARSLLVKSRELKEHDQAIRKLKVLVLLAISLCKIYTVFWTLRICIVGWEIVYKNLHSQMSIVNVWKANNYNLQRFSMKHFVPVTFALWGIQTICPSVLKTI